MKKFLFGMLLALALTGCSYVEPGYVGIRVYQLGGSKGVDHEVLGVGRYWIGWNEKLYTFPTFQQNYVWTKSSTEGKKDDESFSFQLRGGMSVNADFGISYAIDPSKVTVLFQKYRGGVEELTSVVLRNAVRDALNEVGATVAIDELYGDKKMFLMSEAQKRVIDSMGPIGVKVEKLYLVGEMRPPKEVLDALNMKIKATQDALRVQNEVAQAKAQAEKDVAIAEGVAKANQIKAASISENLIKWEAIQKWDGKTPLVTGGAVPFVNVPGVSDKK